MRAQKTGLSPREIEILTQLAKGKTRLCVAHELGISTNTISKHLERAFRFLGATNAVEAVLKIEKQQQNQSLPR